MKRLTGWTILLTIPTIIGGLWGMNLLIPLSEHPLGFLIVFAFTGLVSFTAYRVLKNHDLM